MSKPVDPGETGDNTPSKTRVKNEMEALQKVGMRLTGLSKEQLGKIPMNEALAQAVHEYRRLKKHEAKRRQGQYIGRIMRDSDVQPIIDALDKIDANQAMHIQHFHSIEQWRERLLLDPHALTDFFTIYPEADKQQLRQLIDKTRREQKRGKDAGSNRKLFRFIRSTMESFPHPH